MLADESAVSFRTRCYPFLLFISCIYQNPKELITCIAVLITCCQLFRRASTPSYVAREMSTKRSADDISALSSTATSSGGISSGKKRPKHAPADINVDPIRACLLNPDVPLAKMMLFLDVDDVPDAARTCKCWRDILVSIEDELWLGLVRKHRPSVERITALLPDHVGKATSAASDDIPPPSRSWKRQFQRHRMIEDPSRRVSLRPQPLDSYFFEVQYTLLDAVNRNMRDQVSIVIESASLSIDRGENHIGLRHTRDFIAEHLTTKNNLHKDSSFVNLLVRIFDRSTGRQAIVYNMHHPHLPSSWNHAHNLANIVRRPRDENCVEIDLKSGLMVHIDDSEMVQIALYFAIGFELDDDDNSIDMGWRTSNLDKSQVLDILQNKLAWK